MAWASGASATDSSIFINDVTPDDISWMGTDIYRNAQSVQTIYREMHPT